MIHTLYIEGAIRNHPRTEAICRRFPQAQQIPVRRYGEVFNRRAQNFRLQKRRPALILARKFDGHVLEAPPGYGIGRGAGYYFSHMLNCIYDCRYCFLQGMYRSAHYLLFVNYEDFQAAIERTIRAAADETTYFFSGYDCDSLALDPVSGFVEDFVPFFARHPRSFLELRTKSTQIGALTQLPPTANCIVAFSFTPQEAAQVLEHKTPTIERRLAAMERLQELGFRLGLRFDPLIYFETCRAAYRRLFRHVFKRIRVTSLHSVVLGTFRLPRNFYRTMSRLYPDEKLLAGPLEENDGMVSYKRAIEEEMVDFCTSELLRYIPPEIFFPATR